MQDIDENAIIQRIKTLRLQSHGVRGKSQFAKTLGISPSTYSYYEKKRIPPIETLLLICKVTGADLEWLLTGRKVEKEFSFQSNSTLLRTIDCLLSENPELAEPVMAFIEVLAEKKHLGKSSQGKFASSVPIRPGWIPVLGTTAAGIVHSWSHTLLSESADAATELSDLVKQHTGNSIVSASDHSISLDLQSNTLANSVKKSDVNLLQVDGTETDGLVEFVQCEQIHNLYPDSFALRVDGDSMSPRINDGDIVLLSPSVAAAQGQVCIAHVEDQIGVTCKIFRSAENTVHLVPINEKYEARVIEHQQLRWTLAVLCHISL